MGFSWKLDIPASLSNCKFKFYLEQVHVGQIIFHITYHEASIGWLTIFDTNGSEEYRRKGYGTKMLLAFEKYINRCQSSVTKIVLIPKGFDGQSKNYLCTFYEKSGYIQETDGQPFYIKRILRNIV